MSFFDSVILAFFNYFNFSGRATRSEFWWFFLFCILLYLLALSLSIDDLQLLFSENSNENLDSSEIALAFLTSWFGIAILITLIPQVTLSVRRFHDLDMSGWWYFFLQIVPSLLPNYFVFEFISLFALFLFVYFMVQRGGEDNRFGPNKLKSDE